MAHVYIPPPSAGHMMHEFSLWMAAAYRIKIIVTLDHGLDGHETITIDRLPTEKRGKEAA